MSDDAALISVPSLTLVDSVSRRELLWLGTMGSLALTLGCRSSRPPAADPRARRQLDELVDYVSSLKTKEPGLPGLVSADTIAQNAFGGLSEADATLLGGRLYLDALQRLSERSAGRGTTAGPEAAAAYIDLSPRATHAALERPLPGERFGKEYFTGLLEDTKSRAARDAGYRRQLAEAGEGLRARVSCECNVGPCWLCIIIIIVIIIIVF